MSQPTDEGARLVPDSGPFDDAALHNTPPTAKDSTGVERIVGVGNDGWTPAQVDPDPEQVARQEEAQQRLAQARQAGRDALTDSSQVGETAQPLVDANKATEEEHKAALAGHRQHKAKASPSNEASE